MEMECAMATGKGNMSPDEVKSTCGKIETTVQTPSSKIYGTRRFGSGNAGGSKKVGRKVKDDK